MKQQIYRAGCGGCKRAIEDPQERYICSQLQQHGAEYEKQSEYF